MIETKSWWRYMKSTWYKGCVRTLIKYASLSFCFIPSLAPEQMEGIPLPFLCTGVHQGLTHPKHGINQLMPMAYSHKSVLHLPWVDSLSVFLSGLLLVMQYCWSRLSKHECCVVRVSYNTVTVLSHDSSTLTKWTTHKCENMFDFSEKPTVDVTPLLCLDWSCQLQSRHNTGKLREI